MGANMSSRAAGCFAPKEAVAGKDAFISDHREQQQYEDHKGLGHSFCYVRPDNNNNNNNNNNSNNNNNNNSNNNNHQQHNSNAFQVLPSEPEDESKPEIILLHADDAAFHGGCRREIAVAAAAAAETAAANLSTTESRSTSSSSSSSSSFHHHHHHHSEPSFKTISGASVSANTATPRSTTMVMTLLNNSSNGSNGSSYSSSSINNNNNNITTTTTTNNNNNNPMGGWMVDDSRAAAFEATRSFTSMPLQPVPRNSSSGFMPHFYGLSQSGPIFPGAHNRAISQPYNSSIATVAGSAADDSFFSSGPLERGFMSGPLERGFMSGPLERGWVSAPISVAQLPSAAAANYSSSSTCYSSSSSSSKRRPKSSFAHAIKKALSKTLSFAAAPKPKLPPAAKLAHHSLAGTKDSLESSSENNPPAGGVVADDGRVRNNSPPLHRDEDNRNDDDGDAAALSSRSSGGLSSSHNLQWAQGKAGEDRVHVVLSEDHAWLFVGIYDGFSGPDAPDFLMSNLYREVYKQLRGLLWDQNDAAHAFGMIKGAHGDASPLGVHSGEKDEDVEDVDEAEQRIDMPNYPRAVSNHCQSGSSTTNGSRTDHCAPAKPGIECSEHHERAIANDVGSRSHGLDAKNAVCSAEEEPCTIQRSKKKEKKIACYDKVASSHEAVLRALEKALESTEAAYLRAADRSVTEVPELALMGSCVLVMLMKGADVYVMNVGDSRAILARSAHHHESSEAQTWKSGARRLETEKISARDSQLRQELSEKIREESSPAASDAIESPRASCPATTTTTSMQLTALQLSTDHSTNVKEEVARIKAEHPDDSHSIFNDRVKGRLKVTRAFGAGFLKKPRWNDALLQVFRVDYVGIDPYLTCKPALRHHSLGPNDRFLVLSSDGLYQYLSNDEAVSMVGWFMENYPDGDPAQYLIEELLFRAAKKAGMDFHELLDIPQGDRRSYHDDVCVMVISLEGRIWRSFG